MGKYVQEKSQYISDKSVAKRYEIGRSTVWAWLAVRRLPQPYKLTPQTTRWLVADLDAFDEQNHRGRPGGEK